MTKLTLFTNIISIHQLPVAKLLTEQLNGEFSMVCWEPPSAERTKLGWDKAAEVKWLVQAWASESEKHKAMALLHSSETVIWGYAPLAEINRRVEAGKLTFCYNERPLKRGRWRLISPRVLKWLYDTYHLSNSAAYHTLAVGPHCASDYKLMGMFRNKMWRWGYFPQVFEFPTPKPANEIPTVLWVGRMLDWKRVDLLLKAAAWARKYGNVPFRVRIIGYGPEEAALRWLAEKLHLSDICSFEGPMGPQEIAKAMFEADIYFFPSSSYEGWGAVVNEAMSQGCCVIGSSATGSAPWLIQHGVNGFLFSGGSPAESGKILLACLENPQRTHAIGLAA